MTTKTIHPYITRKKGVQGGKPIISGTRTPVRSVVFYHKMGDAPEEICTKFPHLTLSHVYDALSFYYDHRDEIDSDMEEDKEGKIKQEFGL